MSIAMTEQEVSVHDVRPELVGARVEGGLNYASQGGLRMRSPPRVEDEDDAAEDEHAVQQEPFAQGDEKWIVGLTLASGIDVVISGAVMSVAFRNAYEDSGVSLYCLGIQALSHLLSSTCLALRFAGEYFLLQRSTDGGITNGLLRKSRRRFLVREQIFGETMGIVMLISSVALLFKAFRKMKFWNVWYKDHEEMDARVQYITEVLAWYGFSIYILQAIVRLASARKLKRQLIWHGFCASVVSLVFLFFLGLAASYEKEWSWRAEPIAAIALAFVTCFEGVRIVIMHLDDMDDRLRFDPRA
jgi:hypothetical protein